MKDKVKEQLDIWEKILTIIVSLMAIYGTISGFKSGFFHKVSRLVDHYHHELEKDVRTDLKKDVAIDLKKDL